MQKMYLYVTPNSWIWGLWNQSYGASPLVPKLCMGLASRLTPTRSFSLTAIPLEPPFSLEATRNQLSLPHLSSIRKQACQRAVPWRLCPSENHRTRTTYARTSPDQIRAPGYILSTPHLTPSASTLAETHSICAYLGSVPFPGLYLCQTQVLRLHRREGFNDYTDKP